MHIDQITVFLENSVGRLAEITRLLADANVDIRALNIAETTNYGLVRMVVNDSYKASNTLLKHGDMLSMTPVWVVEVPDKPGGLAELLTVLAAADVNVEYMYSLFSHKAGNAYMAMRISDEPKFLSTLGDRKIKLMTKEELGLK